MNSSDMKPIHLLLALFSMLGVVSAQEVSLFATPATPTVGGVAWGSIQPSTAGISPPYFLGLDGPTTRLLSITNPPYEFNFSNLPVGNYLLSVGTEGNCSASVSFSIEYCGHAHSTKPSLGLACEAGIALLDVIHELQVADPLTSPTDIPSRKSLFGLWGPPECLLERSNTCIDSVSHFARDLGTDGPSELTTEQVLNIIDEYGFAGTLDFVPAEILNQSTFEERYVFILCGNESNCYYSVTGETQANLQLAVSNLDRDSGAVIADAIGRIVRQLPRSLGCSTGGATTMYVRSLGLNAGLYFLLERSSDGSVCTQAVYVP